MTLRNVPKAHTLEQQRQEINLIASDLDTVVDGTKTFGGSKTFSSDVTFQSTVAFDGIATFNSSPTFSDNIVANFGDDADLKIYYDGSVGVLTSFIDSDALQIRSESDTSELYATFLKDGPVELYYDGAKKLATNLTGATVLGDLEINDELHSASGTFILKTADQITPGQMVTEAVFGGSMYVPYGFSTYPIGDFPGGSINETSTNAGFSVSNGGQIYIANIGGSALWKGRQVGTAGITSEIDAAGNATFTGEIKVEGSNTPSGLYSGISRFGSLLIGTTSEAVGNARLAIDSGNGNITSVGSATFGGVLQGDQRVVINGAGGKTGSADTLLNYAGDGSTVTASFTADGSASFAGDVISGVYAANEDYVALRGNQIEIGRNTTLDNLAFIKGTRYNNGVTEENFQVLADGSATFADYVTSNEGFYVAQTAAPDGSSIFKSWLGASTYVDILDNGSANFANQQFRIASSGETTIDSPAMAAGSDLFILKSALNSGNEVASIKADGSATFAGSVTASNVSDIRFKENITDANPQLADAVALGSQLKNWDWKDDAPLNEELRAKRFLGLVAQEAEKVCPGLTYTVSRTKQGAELTPETTDEEGNVTPATYEELDDSYKAINHDILVMKLLGAVAEQSAQIETLKTKVESLEASA